MRVDGCERGCLLALLVAAVVVCGCEQAGGRAPAAEAVERAAAAEDRYDVAILTSLLNAAGDADAVEALLADPVFQERIELSSALGPTIEFLAAEALLSIDRDAEARTRYARLARWSASTTRPDRETNSSLGLPALWRWIESLSRQPTPDAQEIRVAAEDARELLTSPLTRPLVTIGLLPSLPQLEEEILSQLSLLAWDHFDDRDAAQGFLVDYVTASRAPRLGERHQQILDQLAADGAVSRDRLDFLRAQRLRSLGSFDEAKTILERLTESEDNHNRANATLSLVRLWTETLAKNKNARARELLSRVIDETKDPFQRQEALLLRALRSDADGFQQDLCALTENYKEGLWTDDALYRLARWHQERGESTRAQALYAELRAFPAENDWQDSAYFRPAMDLYLQGEEENRRGAVKLFEDYRREVPNGALIPLAQFWQARTHEELGETRQAKALFRQLVAEQGFAYYGIRARMHLESGPEAARRLWPGSAVAGEIRAAYATRSSGTLRPRSVYHARLLDGVGSKLYGQLFEQLDVVGRMYPGERLSTIPLDRLEASPGQLLTRLFLLLSLRQDALTAAHLEEDAQNHLDVQVAVRNAGDWPLAVSLAVGTAREYRHSEPVHALPGFLEAAYPPAYRDEILAAAEKWDVPAALVYGLVRRESLFSPTAHSSAGALGLFQFMPKTFEDLDDVDPPGDRNRDPFDWRLLESAGVASRAEYLLDLQRSLDLGARWLREALYEQWHLRLGLDGEPAGGQAWLAADAAMPEAQLPLLTILEHSKGYGNVDRWRKSWQSVGREGDFEYMLETVGSTEGRILTRDVLTATAIAQASGMFGGE